MTLIADHPSCLTQRDRESTHATIVQRPKVPQLDICVLLVLGKIADAFGLGALTAIVMENGRIRGIVTGDTFRRGVARTMVQQCAKKFEEACMPFQYARLQEPGQIALLGWSGP